MQSHLQRSASTLFDHRRYDEAIEMLHECIALDPQDPWNYRLLAWCHIQLDQYKPALEKISQAIELNPESDSAFYTAAVIHIKMKRAKLAQQAIDRALELNPLDPDRWAIAAEISAYRRHWAKSAELAREGLKLDPGHTDCRRIFARAASSLGDHTLAESVMHATLGNEPDDSWVHSDRARILIDRGDYEQAETALHDALRINPENSYARHMLMELAQRKHVILRPVMKYRWWVAQRTAKQIVLLFVLWMVILFGLDLWRQEIGMSLIITMIECLLFQFSALVVFSPILINLILMCNSTSRIALTARETAAAKLSLASIAAWIFLVTMTVTFEVYIYLPIALLVPFIGVFWLYVFQKKRCIQPRAVGIVYLCITAAAVIEHMAKLSNPIGESYFIAILLLCLFAESISKRLGWYI